MPDNLLIIEAAALFDAAGTEHTHGASVWVTGERILGVYGHEAPKYPANARVLRYPQGCILPGLMDSHVHLTLGTADRHNGPRTYDHIMEEDRDGLMLLRCVRNGYRHLLQSGVTTMRDAGARHRTTFDLKDGLHAGLFHGFPTVHVCGRSITITGGHFHFCGEEADGPDACRLAVRRLVKEGADFIKVMGSGGGTYITDNRRASYTVEELRAITGEARRHGKRTTIHALAAGSVEAALEADFDSIEHYEFIELDETRRFDRRLLDRMISKNVWLSPTIQTGYRRMRRLMKVSEERPLTPEEQETLTYLQWKHEGQLYGTGTLYRLGARRFLMGTDAIEEFGDYAIGLELMVKAGLPNRDALLAATRNCAEAFGIESDVGTLEPTKLADITVVEGNPLEDIRDVQRVQQVVKRGSVLPMDSLELFPHGSGAVKVLPRKRRPDPKIVRLPED